MNRVFYLIITFLFLGNLFQSTAQTRRHLNDERDQQLGKYSYPVFLQSRYIKYLGTAFLYLSHDTTYLVSNAHVFTGWNPFRQIWECRSDTIWLSYTIRGTAKDTVFAINVTKVNGGQSPEFKLYEKIDLMKIPIIPPSGLVLNYINSFVDPSYFDKTPDSIFYYGYPTAKLNPFRPTRETFKAIVHSNGYAYTFKH